ncbi:ATP-binding cassette domain-containing protein [uncultured Flavobacterium sp.]|uniref:ABC transporter ATP-binding protein n=1 Tax=uncultured Flavobacterium sp. TaxID=165435 RepID=UPI0030EE2146|tara:strand:- start:21855 stop:22793 length:939 start_codon:yes stop_codon:yes gene_type:complete
MLSIQNISFSYLKQKTIPTFSLALEKGKKLAIIGESGCGKSTLLKLIYGLHDLDEGQIFWKEEEVLGPKYHLVPGMDFMKYLAQDFDLMPFITVAENVGKYLSNIDKEKKQNRILELLEIVEMTEVANVKAKFLSGGQMQRVALARVLALEPEVLLLDEPFSHIDNFRKNSLRRSLFKYLKEHNITTIIASHDENDYLSFVDEIIVIKDGKQVANGSPKELIANPPSYYVASLFDDVNEIKASYFDDNSNEVLLVYPNQLYVVEKSKLLVTVSQNYFKGSHYLIEANYEDGKLFFVNDEEIEVGNVVCLKKK